MKTINLTEQLCFTGSLPGPYRGSIRNVLTGAGFQALRDREEPRSVVSPALISDLPDYLDIEMRNLGEDLHCIAIPQYEGYLIDLTKFSDAEDFFAKSLGKNSRKNFRSKFRKLEAEHTIRFEFYFGHIDKTHYDALFDVCYRLMEERFQEKKIYNRNLLVWKDYYKLFYPLILDKKASIFAIYDDEKPITLTLNFHAGDIVFSHIQIYDTDYSRYSMGDIAIYKNVEWCYEHGYKVWDFSKGATDNKQRWSNHIYTFNFHLIHKNTALARGRARFFERKLRLKQQLREKGIIGGRFQLDGLYFYTKRRQLRQHNWKEGSQD